MNINLNLNNLLWRTRGHHWDYTFLLTPDYPATGSWYTFHHEVFAGISPSTDPVVYGGILLTEEAQHAFIATAFRDDSKRDGARRSIAHYMVWFPIFSDPGNIIDLRIRSDWGSAILDAIKPAWLRTFEAEEESNKYLVEVREKNQSLEIGDENAVAVIFDRRVNVIPKINDQQPIDNRESNSIEQSLHEAILEGEAFASGLSGNLGTLKVIISGLKNFREQDDQLECVAKSFGGAPTDLFIQRITPGIHRRVSTSFVKQTIPRRGFDTIFEALQPHFQGRRLNRAQLEVEVAKLLDVTPDDFMVRNLSARLAVITWN